MPPDLQLFDPHVFGIMCLLAGLMFLLKFLADSRYFYTCVRCGAKTEDACTCRKRVRDKADGDS